MSAALFVRKVETKSDLDTFLKFPWTLYKGDPNWVPQLVSMQREKLDKSRNAAWQHMEGDYYVAWRGDKPVGTIAAFINHRHNEYWNEHIGFFGCFEVYDDQEAATALLNMAAQHVQACGCTALRGPASFSTNDECGLLVEGFDTPPVVMYTYNPPYYQRLVENAGGFEKVMDAFGYHLTLRGAEMTGSIEKTFRVIRKNNERRGLTVRAADPKNLKQDLKTLKEIYNKAWDKNWGFVPLTDAELDELVKNLGTFLEPRLTLFAEVDGRAIAFLLALPDLFQALHRAYPRPGKPDLLSMAQVLWHWKIRSKITRIRIPLLGVEEEYRGIGAEAAMFAELYDRAVKLAGERGWDYGDGGWVLETNEPMNRLCDTFGGRAYRRFRFYERKLNPS
jgi:GNAT superfamily N-acetyltransferase